MTDQAEESSEQFGRSISHRYRRPRRSASVPATPAPGVRLGRLARRTTQFDLVVGRSVLGRGSTPQSHPTESTANHLVRLPPELAALSRRLAWRRHAEDEVPDAPAMPFRTRRTTPAPAPAPARGLPRATAWRTATPAGRRTGPGGAARRLGRREVATEPPPVMGEPARPSRPLAGGAADPGRWRGRRSTPSPSASGGHPEDRPDDPARARTRPETAPLPSTAPHHRARRAPLADQRLPAPTDGPRRARRSTPAGPGDARRTPTAWTDPAPDAPWPARAMTADRRWRPGEAQPHRGLGDLPGAAPFALWRPGTRWAPRTTWAAPAAPAAADLRRAASAQAPVAIPAPTRPATWAPHSPAPHTSPAPSTPSTPPVPAQPAFGQPTARGRVGIDQGTARAVATSRGPALAEPAASPAWRPPARWPALTAGAAATTWASTGRATGLRRSAGVPTPIAVPAATRAAAWGWLHPTPHVDATPRGSTPAEPPASPVWRPPAPWMPRTSWAAPATWAAPEAPAAADLRRAASAQAPVAMPTPTRPATWAPHSPAPHTSPAPSTPPMSAQPALAEPAASPTWQPPARWTPLTTSAARTTWATTGHALHASVRPGRLQASRSLPGQGLHNASPSAPGTPASASIAPIDLRPTERHGPHSAFVSALATVDPGPLRPAPAAIRPLVQALARGRQVRFRTGEGVRRALAAAGKQAATIGSVVHLPSSPERTDLAVVAHELVHAARPSPTPRFFDDPRPSAEERLAHRVEETARAVRRSSRPGPALSAATTTRPATAAASAVSSAAVAASAGSTVAGGDPAAAPLRSARASVTRATDAAVSSAAPTAEVADATARVDADLVDKVVDELADRVQRELERRGLRFRSEVF